MRTMYDSTSSRDIPQGVQAVAGYVDGLYAWSALDWGLHVGAAKVRICIFPTTLDADVIDVEPGAATIADAVAWVIGKRNRGEPQVVYCNLNAIAPLQAALAADGQPPALIWLALWNNQADIPPGMFAHQYAGSAMTGQHFDLSVIPDYWGGVDPPPTVAPVPPVPVDAESANALFWQAGADLLTRVAPGLNNDLAASARILGGL